MKKVLQIVLIITLITISSEKSSGQIDVIKGLADGAGSLLSDISPGDIEAGCMAARCCWDGGFFFFQFIIEHHKEIMDMHDLDPTVLSLEVKPNFAYALHYSQGDYYTYINYLPQIRGNLGVFSTDFRYNILTEYTDDVPNSFKSWELLFLINMIPDESFKMSIGSGIYNEMYTDKSYNEHYFGLKIGTFGNRDFIDLDTRVVVDYQRSICPFFEAGVCYNTKIIDFGHLSGYISLGGIYQNYYQAHDIWAAKGGVVFSLH